MHELIVEVIIYNCAISPVYHGAEIFVRICQKILIIHNYKLAILSVCDVNAHVYLLCILYMWKYIVYVRVYCMPIHRFCVEVCYCVWFCEQPNYYSISRQGNFSPRSSSQCPKSVYRYVLPAHSLRSLSCNQPTAPPNKLYQVLPVSKSIVIHFLEGRPVAAYFFLIFLLQICLFFYLSVNNLFQKAVTTQHVTNPFSLPLFYCVRCLLTLCNS